MATRNPQQEAALQALLQQGWAANGEAGSVASARAGLLSLGVAIGPFDTLRGMATRNPQQEAAFKALLAKGRGANAELSARAGLVQLGVDVTRFDVLRGMATRNPQQEAAYKALLAKGWGVNTKIGGSNGARALGGKGGGVRAGAGGSKSASAIKKLTRQTAEAEGLRWGFCHGCTIPVRGAVTAATKPALLKLPCAAKYQKRNQCSYCKKDFKSELPA